MIIKFIYNKLYLNKNMDCVYNPKFGTLVDKSNGKKIYEFVESEMKPYCYFTLDFDSYQYEKYLIPMTLPLSKTHQYPHILQMTSQFKKEVKYRIYNINLCININSILNNIRISASLHKKLSYYFAILQMKQIISKKNYIRKINEIKQFIKQRETTFIYLIPWKYFELNEDYLYDFQYKQLIKSVNVPKIIFKRKGGIIETNNVNRLIKENFIDNENILIIMPTNMINIWKKYNFTIMTYDELLNMNNNDIKKYTKLKISKIFIHECHIQFLVGIKNFIKYINCDIIWIINSLPLRYYFSINNTPQKITLSDILTLSNIWIGFEEVLKKKFYKTELVRLFLTKFNNYYTQINYTEPQIDFVKKLLPSDFEKKIYNNINKFYLNWKNKLQNNDKNIYSRATENIIKKLEHKIYNSTITLSLSVVDNSKLRVFFMEKIIDTLDLLDKYSIKMNKMKDMYSSINNLIELNMNNNNYLKNMLDNSVSYFLDKINVNLDNICSKKKTSIKYLKYDYLLTNTSCPICYEEQFIYEVKLVCGHSYCLECLISSLSNKNECPCCREFITLEKIAIINYNNLGKQMKLNSLLKSMNETDVIITDLKCFNNIFIMNELKCDIININSTNIFQQINNLTKIKNVYLLVDNNLDISDKKYSELFKLIGYFKLYNNGPHIHRIVIDF